VEGELMSFSSLINSSLTTAFKLLKDLAVDMDYTSKTASEFDFNAIAISEVTDSFSAKTIIIDKKIGSKERPLVSMQLLANTKDIGHISNFDSVTYLDETWKIGENIKDNGFIALFTVYRESSNG
jgi:hypothetical protein